MVRRVQPVLDKLISRILMMYLRVWRGERRGEREIGLGLGAAEGPSGVVVGSSGVLGRVKGPEPNPSLLPGVSDLCSESAPRSLPHTSKPNRSRSVLGFSL